VVLLTPGRRIGDEFFSKLLGLVVHNIIISFVSFFIHEFYNLALVFAANMRFFTLTSIFMVALAPLVSGSFKRWNSISVIQDFFILDSNFGYLEGVLKDLTLDECWLAPRVLSRINHIQGVLDRIINCAVHCQHLDLQASLGIHLSLQSQLGTAESGLEQLVAKVALHSAVGRLSAEIQTVAGHGGMRCSPHRIAWACHGIWCCV
jgi:hypothetical protein